MCGGASQVLVDAMDLPRDIEIRLKQNGLFNAQSILDERRESLLQIGLSDGDIDILSERIHNEVDQRID